MSDELSKIRRLRNALEALIDGHNWASFDEVTGEVTCNYCGGCGEPKFSYDKIEHLDGCEYFQAVKVLEKTE